MEVQWRFISRLVALFGKDMSWMKPLRTFMHRWLQILLSTGGGQVVAGWRGMNTPGIPGVRLYVPQNELYTKWTTYQLSGKETAVEDIKSGDLNGDKRPDLVVACRQTHNLRILWIESR